MSAAKKKPAAREVPEQSAEQMFRQYADVMREAGSPNGAWNPDPEDHTQGMIRPDVTPSPNESKAIFGVKFHCLRHNAIKGRTAWGWTPTGKPFRVTELAAFYGWDEANTLKWIKRPLEWGFIRRKEDGQLGIGAWVRGVASDEDVAPENESEVELLVRTDKLPTYLAEAVCSQLTESEKVNFLAGWRAIRTDSQQKLNSQKQRIYEQEQRQLDQHCKAFAEKLPRLKRKRPKDLLKNAAPDLSVQTSKPDSVHEPEKAAYKAPEESVRTGYIRNQSKAVIREDSSSSVEEQATTPTIPRPEIRAQLKAELRRHGNPDDAIVEELWDKARAKDPEVTIEEVCQLIQEKAPSRKGAGFRYFVIAVVNALPLERSQPTAPDEGKIPDSWKPDDAWIKSAAENENDPDHAMACRFLGIEPKRAKGASA